MTEWLLSNEEKHGGLLQRDLSVSKFVALEKGISHLAATKG